jgi:hypothetical protein
LTLQNIAPVKLGAREQLASWDHAPPCPENSEAAAAEARQILFSSSPYLNYRHAAATREVVKHSSFASHQVERGKYRDFFLFVKISVGGSSCAATVYERRNGAQNHFALRERFSFILTICVDAFSIEYYSIHLHGTRFPRSAADKNGAETSEQGKWIPPTTRDVAKKGPTRGNPDRGLIDS